MLVEIASNQTELCIAYTLSHCSCTLLPNLHVKLSFFTSNCLRDQSKLVAKSLRRTCILVVNAICLRIPFGYNSYFAHANCSISFVLNHICLLKLNVRLFFRFINNFSCSRCLECLDLHIFIVSTHSGSLKASSTLLGILILYLLIDKHLN